MNILIIPPGALPIPAYKGGAVEALIQSYINFNETQKNDIQFTIYTIEDFKEDWNNKYKKTEFKFINQNSIFYKVNRIFRYIINNKLPKVYIGNAFCSEVVKKLKKENKKYDAIIVENNPFAVLQLRKIYNDIPIIFHLHNDYLNSNTKKCKEILNQYDKIIAISEYIKKRIETIGSTDKIKVIYNGINTRSFNEEIKQEILDEYRKKYDINESDKVLLFVGRLIKEKGINELIDACIRLIDEGQKNLKLIVIGTKASSDSKNDRFINELMNKGEKYKDNIKFTGFIEYQKLPIFHQISDIQIIPSKWGEPLGNVVLEGRASGIKQIVTNDGGIPEVVDEKAATIIETNNLTDNLYKAIKYSLKSEDLSKKPNEMAIEAFSEETYSKNIIDLIEREINEYNQKNK